MRQLSTHKLLCWQLSKYCNRKCSFCLSDSNPDRQIDNKKNYSVYIDRLITLGVKKISYTGGEPLLHPDITTIVKLGRSRGLEQLITTNGDVLDKRYHEAIDHIEYLKISFYGNKPIHNQMMGNGHYQKLMRVCSTLSLNGIEIGANYVLTAKSISCLPEFLMECSKAGVKHVLILLFIPTGNIKIDSKFSVSWESVKNEIIISSKKYVNLFNKGIKIHNYSISDFFLVLEHDDTIVLPRTRLNSWRLGNLFDTKFKLPDGSLVDSEEAVEKVWHERSITNAIIPI